MVDKLTNNNSITIFIVYHIHTTFYSLQTTSHNHDHDDYDDYNDLESLSFNWSMGYMLMILR